jgi:hypothetical protein
MSAGVQISTLLPNSGREEPQRSWELILVVALLLAALGFGVVVEYRSTFLTRRMTDLDVYLRAAWAVRTGADIYTITDDNGWHYHYPPLLAIVLTPLADAPPGHDRTGMLPFGVSVGLWYIISIACLSLATHALACALEDSRAGSTAARVPDSRRFWIVRLVPLLICLPPVGHTLMRGQVNLLLLCLLAFMAAAYVRGQSWRAGLWLAGAICLKIIPAYLLIYPLWRRDFRSLVACGAGLAVGLGLVPILVFGPEQSLEYYREWDDALRRPALADGANQSRAKELIDVTATDSQSYLAVLHNVLHWERSTRPAQATPAVRLCHWLIGGLLTLLTLRAGGFSVRRRREDELLFMGGLILMMILLSPVCHLHYFCLVIPLVMGITGRIVTGTLEAKVVCLWGLLGIGYLVAEALPQLPKFEKLRDLGLVMFAALFVWGVALIMLMHRRDVAQRATGGQQASSQFDRNRAEAAVSRAAG